MADTFGFERAKDEYPGRRAAKIGEWRLGQLNEAEGKIGNEEFGTGRNIEEGGKLFGELPAAGVLGKDDGNNDRKARG